MQVSVSDAKGQLTDLVRRAEAGEEIILSRRGKPAVKLVAAERARPSDEERWALLEALHGSARDKFGPGAARSADFLYDDFGLPA
jgi:prevent-host-death family protein